MKNIDDLVYGHKQAKKVISALLRRSKERYYKKCVLGNTDNLQDTLKCLLIGPSGTGKTHLIQSFSQLNSFPLICLDATQLMPSGNSDGINSKQLTNMIRTKCLALAETPEYHSPEGALNQLVIFVDEIDKLGVSFDSSGNWNRHVQANFLTMINGNPDFEGISWIFAGAFSGLFKNKIKKPDIGFFSEAHSDSEDEITDDDILKAGIIPELLGRINLIVQLDTFTTDDFKRILLERLLPKYTLQLTETDVDSIVAKAYKSGQGIRNMTRQLEMLAIDEECSKTDVYCKF